MVLPVTYAQRLFRVQSFKETAWGTPAAATAKWMGIQAHPTFTPYVKPVIPHEDRGSLQNSHYSFVTKLGGEYTINWDYASFEDILFPLYNTFQSVTPGAGPPYLYTFVAPTSGANALQPYTLEYGYDILTGQYAGCFGHKLTIKGEMEKQWELALAGFYKSYTPNVVIAIASSTQVSPSEITTATAHGLLTGDQVVITGHLTNTAVNGTWTIIKTGTNTFTVPVLGNGVGGATGTVNKIQTPALSDRTVEAILFNGTALTIDAAAGTIGTTSVPNSLIAFQLDIENNVKPIWTNDSRNPTVYGYDALKGTLMLRLLYNAQVKAILETGLANGGRQLIQLKYTSGAKIAELDFAGVLAADPKRYGNQVGASFVEIQLESQYDTGAFANSVKALITNAVSALP